MLTKCGALLAGLTLVSLGLPAVAETEQGRLAVLIIDGQNNHDWQATTPLLKAALEAAGRFEVQVATAPREGREIAGFAPNFAAYDAIVSNYNGALWPEPTRRAFEDYMREGGGFVVVHAANNAFPEWPAYNDMIGLGGWGGRNEKSGPFVYLDAQQQLVRDPSPGPGGSHGPQHPFQIVIRDPEHPITRGLPRAWMHTQDELYTGLRGPASDLHILATAFADEAKGGTGRHEPMLMTLEFGAGRIFHTTLGHATYSMECVGFVTTLQRGTEWAATGRVTLPVPENFPTAETPRIWQP